MNTMKQLILSALTLARSRGVANRKGIRTNAGATALESVEAPFEMVVGIYDLLRQVLGPAGLTLDYERIKAERPRIAQLLKGERP